MLATSSAAAQQPGALEAAVQTTILTNPEVRARFQEFQAKLEGEHAARGALLPQVSAQGWTGHEWRGSNSDTSAHQWDRNGYRLELRQLLFDGYFTANNIKQLGFEKLADYYSLMVTVDSLALEAATAYTDARRYREMEQLAKENYAIHRGVMAQLRERQDSGVGRGVDLEQAKGRLALAQTNLMTESNNLNDVIQRYRRIVGEFPLTDLAPAPDVSVWLPQDPRDFGPTLRTSAAVLSKQALVQAAKAGLAAAKGRNAPTVEFKASTGVDREQPGANYRNIQNSQVQLVLSYNLFDGGADSARIRQTAALTYSAQDVRDHTCRAQQQDLSITWNSIARLHAQMPFLRDHELAISKVRVAYNQQFQIGQRSLLDLLDTENELFDARRALLSAEYDLLQAQFRWLALAGRILPALGLAAPQSDQPEEADELRLPEDIVRACLTPVPDTSNLAPIVIEYGHGLEPPVISLGDGPPTSGSRP